MLRKHAPSYETVDGQENPPVVVKIPRIRCIDPANDLYEIEGLTHRNVDWHAVFVAAGYPSYPGDRLANDVGVVLFRHDLVQALSERIEPA